MRARCRCAGEDSRGLQRLAKKGNDDDFGKLTEKMIAIENGPFSMAKLGYSFFFEAGDVTR